MKFNVAFSVLSRAISSAAMVARLKTPGLTPPRRPLRLEVADGRLTIVATSRTDTMRVALDLQLITESDPGVLHIDGDTISALLRGGSSRDRVIVESGERELSVRVGTGPAISARLYHWPPPSSENPTLAPVHGSQSVWVDAARFARAFRAVYPAISTDGGRPNITGAGMTLGDGEMRVDGTDCYRLARYRTPAMTGETSAMSAIVPMALVRVLCQRPGIGVSGAVVEIAGEWITVQLGSATYSAKKIGGTFPGFAGVIPPVDDSCVSAVSRAALMAVLRQAAEMLPTRKPWLPTRKPCVMITCEAESPTAAMTWIDDRQVEYSCSMRLDRAPIRGFQIGVNPHYMLDALGQFEAATVTLQMMSDVKLMVTSDDPADAGMLSIVMLMRA